MLAGDMSDDLVLTIGTLSKLFWGGLRIGWLRASSTRIRQLIERRKAEDLASPISTQVVATNLMTHVGKRVESDERSSSRPGATCEVVSDVFPAWVWTASQSGTGLWADTHNDSSALAEAAKRVGFDWLRGRDIRLMTGSGQCCGFLSGMNRSRSRKHWECCAEPSLIGDDAD